MDTASANLPLVIQQSGDASRVQDSVQRLGQFQQLAAQAEVAQQQLRQQGQVQQSQPPDTGNRVRADQQGGSPQGQPRGRRPAPAQAKDKQEKPPAPAWMETSVVDVVV